MQPRSIMTWFYRILPVALVLLLSWAEPPVSQGIGTSVTIAQSDSSGIVIAEGDDFATRILRAPWDMSAFPYPDFPTVLGNFYRSSFTVSGGQWSMYTTNNDPRINIHPTGLAQPVLNVGSRFPIDTSRYFLLSFRMCSSQSGEGQVFWFYDQTFTKFAYSRFFPVSAGCYIYVVDLRYAFWGGRGGVTGWNGTPIGLSIDPLASGSNVHIQLDWVRLTTGDTSRSVPITWQVNSPGSTLEFYVDTDNSGYDGTKIGRVTSAPSTGTFQWGSALLHGGDPRYPYPLPESLQPGQYYVYVTVNGTPGGYSSNYVTVDAMPIVTFLRPSFTSGRDYATVVVGDAWDMSNPGDVSGAEHIAISYFADGIYHAVSDEVGDPQVLLHTGAPIDTSRYKYLTYRLYVEGTQDIGRGWVSRVYWWNQGPTIDYVSTDDIVVYEGWHTYSVDLSQVGLEPSPGPGWSGQQRALRLDPVEVPALTAFHLDYMMLTADERIQQGVKFPVIYQVSESTGVTVTLCYDTNQNSGDGKAPLAVYVTPTQPSGPFAVYLPLVVNLTSDLPRLSGVAALWDTTLVGVGAYYLCADVNDGANTATWYSETPVIITTE